MELLVARALIIRCAGGNKMGIQRKAKPAFAALRKSTLFKTALEEEQVYLLRHLADELEHRMAWETLIETL